MNLSKTAVITGGALLSLFAFSAQAGTPGWYIGGEGGASFLQDADSSLQFPAGPGTGGTGGTGGGGLITIPGLITLFPTPPGAGSPGAPGAPGSRTDFDNEFDLGFVGGITAGRLFANGLRSELELRYSKNDFDKTKASTTSGGVTTAGPKSGANGDVTSVALMANLFYDFNRDGSLHPYIGGGVGGARVAVNDFGSNSGKIFDGDDIVFAYQGGAGLAFDLTDRLTLDAGYRYFGTDDPSFGDRGNDIDFEYKQHIGMLSLRYVISPTGRADSDGDGVPDSRDQCPNTPAGAPVDAKGCPLDSDGDGVPDYLDKCPNTKQGVPVGADGCPLDADGDGVPDNLDECPNTPKGAPVDSKGCPLDSDGDGVPDYMDDCPNTPAGAVVNSRGCPTVVDSDGDGVPDAQDLCPDTPKGVPVLSNGCAADQSAILKGVNYEFNSAKLTPNAERILDGIAKTLQDSPGFRIRLSGYTDSKGSDSYNQQLSQKRAESARRYLISQGIDAGRIEAVGKGESDPVAPNTNADGSDNPEGRAQNRRTEFTVLR